jgi:hypothetical protein
MYDEPTDPVEDQDRLEQLYKQGYCYDCGEKNCKESH